MLNPFTDTEGKRSTDVSGQLITINVNMKIIDTAQQQKLQAHVTAR